MLPRPPLKADPLLPQGATKIHLRPFPLPVLAGLLLCTLFSAPSAAREVQRHGLEFEHWLCDTFFGGYRPPSYTAKWDIPGHLNPTHGGLPINPKATKWGSPINLGDALRQFDIAEPFWLIIGFWEQRGDEKWFVHIFARTISPQEWRALWHPITRHDLEALDAIVKNRQLDHRQSRRLALETKQRPPFSQSVIQVNPKIDASGQRRLQCSIRFADLFQKLGGTTLPPKTDHPRLWGHTFPNPIPAPPRSFKSR